MTKTKLVVNAFALSAADLHLIPAFIVDLFPGPSKTGGLKIGTPVANLPDAWCYRVSTGTGWPCVSIL